MTDGDSMENEQEPEKQRTRPDGGTDVMTQSGGPTGPSLNDDGEVEPVEVLVGLAEDDEIDPWDIDVVRVTDKFLERIDEADLRTSGRALFYASVLLRMKSDALLEDDPEDEVGAADEPVDPWAGDGPDVDGDPFDALEDEMDRRLDRKRARGTPETLDDLVRELREAERSADWKESREYDTSDSPRGFRRGTQKLDYRMDDDMRAESEPTVEDVTGTAHAENVEELVEAVATKVETQFDAGRDAVLFAEVDGAAGSRIETFLGLLFLSNQGRLVLDQDEYFGDLWIQPPDSDSAA